MRLVTYYPWEEEKEVFLNGYILDASEQIQAGVLKPAILICPGGAYLRISDQEAEAVALRFAGYGYHAFVLHYSVGQACSMERVLTEAARSMAYIRSNAEEWMLDSRKIAVCGFSAGGHLCASLSTRWKLAAQMAGIEASQARPDAVILGYPVTDLTIPLPPLPLAAFSEENPDSESPEKSVLPAFQSCVFKEGEEWSIRLGRGMCQALLGDVDPEEGKLREGSPCNYITENTPPTYLWATCNDEMVSPGNSLQYAAGLMARGVPVEFHLFGDGPHGLSLADATSAPDPGYINPACQQWIPMVRTWLESV